MCPQPFFDAIWCVGISHLILCRKAPRQLQSALRTGAVPTRGLRKQGIGDQAVSRAHRRKSQCKKAYADEADAEVVQLQLD